MSYDLKIYGQEHYNYNEFALVEIEGYDTPDRISEFTIREYRYLLSDSNNAYWGKWNTNLASFRTCEVLS